MILLNYNITQFIYEEPWDFIENHYLILKNFDFLNNKRLNGKESIIEIKWNPDFDEDFTSLLTNFYFNSTKNGGFSRNSENFMKYRSKYSARLLNINYNLSQNKNERRNLATASKS